MKKNNKKGFTLAELLIVVAIIAVLVAVAIPVFSAQLEKSRDATSVANLRSAYAEAVTALLTGDSTSKVAINIDNSGNGSITVKGVNILTQKKDNWNSNGADLPFTVSDGGSKNSNATVSFAIASGDFAGTATYS